MPEIIVHEHCGESGAIGAAQEALRLWSKGKTTTFIGLAAVEQMFQAWAPLLGLSREENARAIAKSFEALDRCEADIRREARQTLDLIEREDRIGIVMLGRVYHHDPGLNHEIMEEFQKLGYPIFSQSTLPMDEDMLDRLFGDEVRAGLIKWPLDIADVWKNNSLKPSTTSCVAIGKM